MLAVLHTIAHSKNLLPHFFNQQGIRINHERPLVHQFAFQLVKIEAGKQLYMGKNFIYTEGYVLNQNFVLTKANPLLVQKLNWDQGGKVVDFTPYVQYLLWEYCHKI